MITTGTRITFNSQFQHGNGSWQVITVREDGVVWMGRLGKSGQLLKPNADNMMNVSMVLVSKAIEIGTAKVL